MKNQFILILFTFTLVSCGPNASVFFENDSLKKITNIEADDETTQILNLISGTYKECIASVMYPGYYSEITHSLTDEDVTLIQTLSASSNCSSPYYEMTSKYQVTKATYADAGLKIFNIDAKWKSVAINFKHNYYIGQNYCGYTDWALNVTKDLTGVSCPALLSYDTHHSSYKNLNDEEFLVYKVDVNTLSLPLGNDESGDSINERKNSQFGIIEKN